MVHATYPTDENGRRSLTVFYLILPPDVASRYRLASTGCRHAALPLPPPTKGVSIRARSQA
eukprot:8794309-Pyramimonas_sp.AAC.2